MSKREVERLVRELQVRMHLRHWEIRVVWDSPADHGSDATLDYANTYDDAELRFAAGWRSWGPYRMRQTILHELGHAVMRDLQQAVESSKDELEGSAWNLYYDRFLHELEGVVDRYATIIATEMS